MLASSFFSIGPGRRLGGAGVVVGLHAVALVVVLVATERREVLRAPAPAPVQVRLLASPPPQPSVPPRPLTFAPRLVPPPPVTVPLPDLPELRPLPERPAITAAAMPTTDVAPVATTTARDDGSASRPAAPEQVEHIAYAHFEPPQYPPLSRRLGEQGVVVLRVRSTKTDIP